jgi:hypothetical protein
VPPLPPVGTRGNNANCLDPLNTPPGAQRNGAGWILNTTSAVPQRNITTAPQDPTTRAEQATACLANPTGPGQGAQQLDIAGWQDAQRTATRWGMPIPGAVARCHLVADVLGGQGFAQNLVPCWQVLVNIGQGSMRAQETLVQQELRVLPPGAAVYYQVTPNYANGVSTVPTSISMTAQVQAQNGAVLNTFVNVTIPNETYVDGAVVPLGN